MGVQILATDVFRNVGLQVSNRNKTKLLNECKTGGSVGVQILRFANECKKGFNNRYFFHILISMILSVKANSHFIRCTFNAFIRKVVLRPR